MRRLVGFRYKLDTLNVLLQGAFPVADTTNQTSLGEQAAYQLANVTKTAPIYGAVTPRWLVRLLDWKPLESGIFRRNRVVEEKPIDVLCGHVDESEIPETYAEYEEEPREY